MVRWRLAALAGTLLMALPAHASSTFCEGQMRAPDCQGRAGFVWPEDSHPTVGVVCIACSINGDGGGSCIDIYPDLISVVGNSLFVQVENRTYGSEYFEETKIRCDRERVYRYVGPLEPGRLHVVVLPGMSRMSVSNLARFTIPFQVAGEPRDLGRFDASAPPVDAFADASMVDDDPPRPPRPAQHSGCSIAPRDTAAAPFALLVCLLVVSARRHGR
jgi:hypothetical protein